MSRIESCKRVGRCLLLLLVVAVVVVSLAKVAPPVYGEWQEFRAWKQAGDVKVVEYRVQFKESLGWIAKEHPVPGKSNRERALEIVLYNGLDNVVLEPDQELLIPYPEGCEPSDQKWSEE